MHETIQVIQNHRSTRAYQDGSIDRDTVDLIINSAMRAPTARNLMLYSIIEITDQTIKEKLAKSCDNQPFIAQAPLVLLFLADYQRWFDVFIASDVESFCKAEGKELCYPGEGD
ncbi:MAG: nitroreductase family protein, partial [Anaerolineae bacterium]